MTSSIRLSEIVTVSGDAVAAAADGSLLGKAWSQVGDLVESGVRDALDVDLVGVLAGGWSKAVELRGYADSAKYPPETKVRMTLAQHRLAIAIDPELTLSVDGIAAQPLQLKVELVADLKGAVLTIADGAITAVDAGKVALSAQLKWGSHSLPLKAMREVELPGRVAIDPPARIPRPMRVDSP